MPIDKRDPLAALGWPIYFVAALMIVTPAVDFVTNVWPPNPGDLQWRYGSNGLLAGFLLTPLLGALLAGLAAHALGHRGMARFIAIFNVVGALLLFAAFVMFSLDVLEYRHAVPAEAISTYDIGALKAASKHLSTALAFAWLAIAGFSASRKQ